MNRGDGRKLVLLAEGDTERIVSAHFKSFLDQRADSEGKPRVRLYAVAFNGSIMKANLQRRVEHHLNSPLTCGVVALADMYPEFKGMSAKAARDQLLGLMPKDERCRAHVAKHDFEAWLLAGWQAILDHGNIASKQPWGAQPEEINHGNPPAHRIRDLFDHHAKPHRKYKKPVDGLAIFKNLDLENVAAVCPEFRLFLNSLLELSGYEPLLVSAAPSRGEKSVPWQAGSWIKQRCQQLALNLLESLARHALAIDDSMRAQIEECADEESLCRWMTRVDTASSVAEIFIEPE